MLRTMKTTTDLTALANRLLADARMRSRVDHSTYGCARHGDVCVTWNAPARTYDVGTYASSHATGARRDVLATLLGLMSS